MKHLFTFTACMLAITAAHATCHNGATNYPACDNNKPPATQPSSVTGTQQQQQAQQQAAIAGAAAGAVAGARSTSNSAGGAGGRGGLGGAGGSVNAAGFGANAGAGAGAAAGAGAGAGAGSGNSNGQQVTVNAGGGAGAGGSGDTFIALPSVVPPTPPTTIAGATVVVSRDACGPLQRIIRTPVVGQFMGFWSTSEVPQGYTDELAPYYAWDGTEQLYRQIGGRTFGHQVTQYTAVVSTGGARNVAIGGGSSSGSWAQGGGGASGAAQQMVTTIQLRLCQIEEQPVRVVFENNLPPVAAVRLAPRRAPVRKVAAKLVASPDPACMASAAQSCQAKTTSLILGSRQ